MPDSDWGEDSDSGSIHEPDNYPLSTVPDRPTYEVEWVDADPQDGFGMGTIPFVVDLGSQKILLAPEGCLHVQIMAAANDLIGPVERGYLSRSSGEIKFAWDVSEDLRTAVEEALKPYRPRTVFGQAVEPSDLQECRHCGELLDNCACMSWGEGAEWADEPIDQSSLRELKPAIQSNLTPAQKAAAWDKPDKDLTPAERAYVSKNASGDAQRRSARTCKCPRCELARAA